MIIDLSSESTKFRSISIKSYYQNENNHLIKNFSSLNEFDTISIIEFSYQLNQTITDSAIFTELIKRERDRSRKFLASIAYINFMLNIIINVDFSFIAFRTKEIVELLKKEVFVSINKENVLIDVRIFSSRFMNEIKHSNIEKVFEKSCLMMQAFKNQNKTLVLTQSLIIQKISQRLIFCLIIMFNLEMKLYLRNII
jgi:hypothetical protein